MSSGSKQSTPQQNDTNEKGANPTSPTSRLRPKKKTGFLSFLNCCAAPDETQEPAQPETAQPAQVPSRTQPTRAQQPSQIRQQQDVSQANTSADGSKEVIDEKAAQPPYQDVTAVPISPAVEAEKSSAGDATSEKPLISSPSEIAPVQNNPEIRPLEEKQALVPEEPITGPPHVDAAATTREDPSISQQPDLQVQAPTPVVAQSEDDMLLDRTPEHGDGLGDAVEAIRRRWAPMLTRRELEFALAVVGGASNREIASSFTVSVRTVEVHLGRIFAKLGVRSRVELMLLALRSARHG